jgi:glycosyltransferase involved in cell wall biosynthesis
MAISIKYSICMPAYNEERNIEKTVRDSFLAIQATGGEGEVCVCNDASKDRTGEILTGLKSEYGDRLVVVTHAPKNEGYGRALSDAIKASSGLWVATIDSDGQFDVGQLPELAAKISQGVDFIAGYRERKKDNIVRVIADRGLNMLVRLMFGIRHRDTNCAFKLIRGDLLRSLNIESNGFSTPTEIVLKLHFSGARSVEAPIRHHRREEGKSKLKVFKVSRDFLAFLCYMRKKVNLYKRGIISRL